MTSPAEGSRYDVLFLCTGNSARSILAEAIVNRHHADRFRAHSAGSHPKGAVHPMALHLLERRGIPTEGLRSKPWDEFAQGREGSPALDFVFTVCDDAAGEVCPFWPGHPMSAHWGVPDPAAAEGTEAERHLAFAEAFRLLAHRIAILASLPIASLDRASLKRRLDAIGAARDEPAERAGNAVSGAGDAPPFDLARRLVAEALGTGLLVATVVGSGVMAERLTDDTALALLGNTIPTGAILVVLITVLGPISGAHFNPAVTLAMRVRGALGTGEAWLYAAAQVGGGVLGTAAAHLMFELAPLGVSATVRTGPGQWWAEVVATFGLVGAILGGLRFHPSAIPWLVGLYITAAYWFTASTSFANPAVAVARAFTDSFSGIRPVDVPAFVLAQCAGALLAAALFGWLLSPGSRLTIRGALRDEAPRPASEAP